MNKLPPALVFLRILVALLLFIHGATRLYLGGVTPFGEYLSGRGFPAGVAIAWAITIFELTGTLVLAAGRFVIPLAAGFIWNLAWGIVLVHASAGWFVVGAGRNGMEYSILLIGCLITLILTELQRKSSKV
ncbi:MAG: DoxX family protein [Blastocatellia bacterium]|nr:DoxX family protein [Blastocatellia bacterium]